MAADFEAFLCELSAVIVRDHPHLSGLYSIFEQEARFGRAWLDDSLKELAPGSAILEVGAGIMLLSCQLCREGFEVTALEPIGEGFSSFVELQNAVLSFAHERGVAPKVLNVVVEGFASERQFAFAYSINVMEHVEDVPSALRSICGALAAHGRYRFTCPNYLFPYEPHFNIPTLFFKPLTARVFGNRISRNLHVDDPEGVWRSLNWITVFQIKRAIRALPDVSVRFERTMLRATLARLVIDERFAERRSAWMRRVIGWLVGTGFYHMAVLIPVFVQPIIDCTLRKVGGVYDAQSGRDTR